MGIFENLDNRQKNTLIVIFVFVVCISILLGYYIGLTIKETEYKYFLNNDQIVETTTDVKNKKTFLVTRVIDGDTIEIETGERIRLIGIDTPENVDPRKSVQFFGKEASEKAKEMLEGKTVRLESDPTQDNKDKYGRLLRYVFLSDGIFFNEWMVKNGYAHEYTYQIPYQYQSEFKDAEIYARENKLGLWAENNSTSTTKTDTDYDLLIKGNINSRGEKIYHLPGGQFYDKVQIDESKGERWFNTEKEAIQAGWRKSKR